MSVDEVDVLEVETLKAGVHSLDDVLAGQSLVVHDVVAESSAPVDLPDKRLSAFCVSQHGRFTLGRLRTLVEMTRSLRFQPYFLMAWPMTMTGVSPLSRRPYV